jgi:hypothetical protein
MTEDGSAHACGPPARELGRAAESLAATRERLLGEVDALALSRQPRLGLFDQRVHLGEHRAGGRVFPLERLDALESAQDRGGLVHAACVFHADDASRESDTCV